MSRDPLRDRIAGQFSYRDEGADLWRAFELFLDTDRFLNLGYSAWYQPHALGSSQRRLVDFVGSALAAHVEPPEGAALLDVGCGRGGPTIHLAERYGFSAVGVDLVPYNVNRARENAEGGVASFVVGDAARLPIRTRSMNAATAIDSIVYVPEKTAAFSELSRVLGPGGVAAVSDLVTKSSVTDDEREAVAVFAEAWDMPPLLEKDEYQRALREAGFEVLAASDITAHSVGRFRTWTTLYRWLSDGSSRRLVDGLLRRYGLNPRVIDRQVRRAHDALPTLRHVVVVAEVR